jgi:hypothetical protein
MPRLALLLAAVLLLGPVPARSEEGDIRDLRVGMAVDQIPAEEYVGLACAAAPGVTLQGWSEYRRCPADKAGLHAVSFHFNDALNPLARVNDVYEGTKLAGHPVLLTLLVDDHGAIGALRADTDPKARLFWRKKAYLLADIVRNRFGEEGWDCRDHPPEPGETPVGGILLKRHCEKRTADRSLFLDQVLYRRPGQPMTDFVNETHFEIRRADDRS